jgi:transcriptional regulator with XRE-family HTH domain
MPTSLRPAGQEPFEHARAGARQEVRHASAGRSSTDGTHEGRQDGALDRPAALEAIEPVESPRDGSEPAADQPDRMLFADWLETRLRARRISQRQLAARSGVDHATVSRLLRDGRVPSLATAAKLVRAVGGAEEPDALAALVGGDDEAMDPVCRVERALRSDPALDEPGVARLMRAYLEERRRT